MHTTQTFDGAYNMRRSAMFNAELLSGYGAFVLGATEVDLWGTQTIKETNTQLFFTKYLLTIINKLTSNDAS